MEVLISYPAVLGAAIASMILGFLWYGPLFGNAWMRLSGMTEADKAAAQKKGMGIANRTGARWYRRWDMELARLYRHDQLKRRSMGQKTMETMDTQQWLRAYSLNSNGPYPFSVEVEK